jgi:hypothetical protein
MLTVVLELRCKCSDVATRSVMLYLSEIEYDQLKTLADVINELDITFSVECFTI